MIMSFWQMFYSVGSFICFWVGYATTKYTNNLEEWDWKMPVIFQVLVPTIVCCLVPFIPETPRWYFTHSPSYNSFFSLSKDNVDARHRFIQNGNRIDDARATLRHVRDTEQEVEDEI